MSGIQEMGMQGACGSQGTCGSQGAFGAEGAGSELGFDDAQIEALGKLDEQEGLQVEDLKTMDANGDGSLNKNELTAGLKEILGGDETQAGEMADSILDQFGTEGENGGEKVLDEKGQAELVDTLAGGDKSGEKVDAAGKAEQDMQAGKDGSKDQAGKADKSAQPEKSDKPVSSDKAGASDKPASAAKPEKASNASKPAESGKSGSSGGKSGAESAEAIQKTVLEDFNKDGKIDMKDVAILADQNQDGKIDKSEAKSLIEQLDSNKDGKLGVDELTEAGMDSEAASQLDSSGDGFVDETELTAAQTDAESTSTQTDVVSSEAVSGASAAAGAETNNVGV